MLLLGFSKMYKGPAPARTIRPLGTDRPLDLKDSSALNTAWRSRHAPARSYSATLYTLPGLHPATPPTLQRLHDAGGRSLVSGRSALAQTAGGSSVTVPNSWDPLHAQSEWLTCHLQGIIGTMQATLRYGQDKPKSQCTRPLIVSGPQQDRTSRPASSPEPAAAVDRVVRLHEAGALHDPSAWMQRRCGMTSTLYFQSTQTRPDGVSLVELVCGRVLNDVHQPACSRLLISTTSSLMRARAMRKHTQKARRASGGRGRSSGTSSMIQTSNDKNRT